MGSDAVVYPFDYDLYLNRVVPAIHKLMLSGNPEDWLSPIAIGEWTNLERGPGECPSSRLNALVTGGMMNSVL